MLYESRRFVAAFACGALFPPPQPAKHGDRDKSKSDTIRADLLHGAAVLSCVVEKTLLELTNVPKGMGQLCSHLVRGCPVL